MWVSSGTTDRRGAGLGVGRATETVGEAESPARVQRDWAALLTLHVFPLNVHNNSSQMPLKLVRVWV